MSRQESFRLPGSRRLAASHDFRRVRNEGRSWPHPLLVLNVRPNNSGLTRLGIVVSGRIGSAVVRNRLKRRLREIVRLRLNRLRDGFDTVIVARQRSRDASFANLENAVEQVIRRAGLRST